MVIFRIFQILLFTGLLLGPSITTAQENTDRTSDKTSSIRGSIYSKRYARIEQQGYGAKFRLELSVAVYRINSLEDLLDDDTKLRFNSIGLRPKYQLDFPTRIKHVNFIPTAEMQLTHRFDLNKNLLSGALSGMFRYDNDNKAGNLVAYASLKYGTRYDQDGLNLDDYLRFKLKAKLNHGLDWRVGKHAMELRPFASGSYFFDEFDVGVTKDLVNHIEKTYEIGVELGSEPRMYLWKVRIPEIEISYIFGDGVRGLKIRF
jgi:hypothetical protein